MSKATIFADFQGIEFEIGPTDCGQLVVKVSPAEWDALPPNIQDTIIAIDLLLAREWAAQHTRAAQVTFEVEEGMTWVKIS